MGFKLDFKNELIWFGVASRLRPPPDGGGDDEARWHGSWSFSERSWDGIVYLSCHYGISWRGSLCFSLVLRVARATGLLQRSTATETHPRPALTHSVLLPGTRPTPHVTDTLSTLILFHIFSVQSIFFYKPSWWCSLTELKRVCVLWPPNMQQPHLLRRLACHLPSDRFPPMEVGAVAGRRAHSAGFLLQTMLPRFVCTPYFLSTISWYFFLLSFFHLRLFQMNNKNLNYKNHLFFNTFPQSYW